MKTSDERQWSARPWIALAIQIATVAVPVTLSVAIGWALSHLIPKPPGAAGALWWAALFAVSTAVAFVSERLMRSILPIATLYRLSLVFPGKAPSRRRIAGRASSPEEVRAEVARAWRDGLHADPQRAAETILTLVTSLSVHDRRTRGHSERVRMFTDLIAAEMNIPTDDRNLLRWAALLHDIGKLRVRVETLNKPDTLNDAEWEEIKRHPADGVSLLDPLRSFFGPWMGAILDHHEKYDGSGYPNGVAGDDIQIGARIVAVADAYDTMTASRPYRKAMSPADGRRELAACSGAHFDPAVVRAFMNVSTRRLRWAVGPLSWMTQFPLISRTLEVITARSAGAAISLGSIGGMAGLGVITPPDPPKPTPAPVVFTAAESTPKSTPAPKQSKAKRDAPPKPTPVAPQVPKTVGGPKTKPEPSAKPTPSPSPNPTGTSTPLSTMTRNLYLSSSGSGDVPWSAPLPFADTVPALSPLPNYSNDHDGKPGLSVDRSDKGTAEADPKRYQTWARSGSIKLAGPASISFWSSLENLDTLRRGTVHAELLNCSTPTSCTSLASTTIDDPAWTLLPTWRLRSASFGDIWATIPSDSQLILHLTVPSTSNDSIVFAYGTETYSSKLTLTIKS